ncbi:MAG: respiratory nitrate reductase subunit gamma [Actinobacteria bacterium]|nr:respiratory nitrate reductase subunit gamma [Actinomycetota bacterium]
MTGADLLYAALPAGLVVAGLLAVPLRIRSVAAPVRATLETPPAAWARIPLAWGLGIGIGGLAVAVLAPGMVAGWGSSLVRRVLLEGFLVAVGAWFLIGLLARLYAFAADPDRPRITVADAIVVLGVFTLAVTGILVALTYRWVSLWGSEAAAAWVRSTLRVSAEGGLIGDLPVLARVHALTLFVVLAVYPYSRWVGWLQVPMGAVRRFWADLAHPPSGRPAGAWLGWGPAAARGALVVGYFVVFTVMVPGAVVERLGSSLPAAARDLVVAGTWGLFLAAGVGGLRWLQRKARL